MKKVGRIEISLEDLIRYCSLMTAGKLIGGLFHNINGPLHTLGIEIDVLNHVVLKTQADKPDFLENLSTRFKRMEEEFESINRMIRVAAERVETGTLACNYLDLNHFIREELEFLKANLYFKHQVETNLELSSEVPPLKELPPGLHLALRLLLHGIVDDVEKNNGKLLTLKTSAPRKFPVLHMAISPHENPGNFMEMLSVEPASECVRLEGDNLGICVAALLLKSSGASLHCGHEGDTVWLSTTFQFN